MHRSTSTFQRAATVSDGELASLIERENYLHDMHANMDY